MNTSNLQMRFKGFRTVWDDNESNTLEDYAESWLPLQSE